MEGVLESVKEGEKRGVGVIMPTVWVGAAVDTALSVFWVLLVGARETVVVRRGVPEYIEVVEHVVEPLIDDETETVDDSVGEGC